MRNRILMRCDDSNYYVVKFQNNPQGVRILANDLLGARLAAGLGLPMPAAEVWLVRELLISARKSTAQPFPNWV